jgi:hypothetical protein
LQHYLRKYSYSQRKQGSEKEKVWPPTLAIVGAIIAGEKSVRLMKLHPEITPALGVKSFLERSLTILPLAPDRVNEPLADVLCGHIPRRMVQIGELSS